MINLQVNGEMSMNINKKIALIILAGLLASLLGSFSHLIGMEGVVIKDFSGQTVQLDDAQRVALGQCKTLKEMIADMGRQEIPFEGVEAFITNQNFQRLADLIKDEKALNQIAQNQDEYIALFRCADYMKAPKKVLAVLADRIYEPLARKIESTVNEDEKANLELFYETVESKLSYYPHFNSLLKNNHGLQKEADADIGVSMNFGQKFGRKLKPLKKFKTLEGIEGLSDQPWTCKVTDLRIEGHEMPKIDFAQIKQAFPAINHVLLKSNKLRNISNINASNAAIDLRNNPVESITVNNPRSLKNTKIVIDKEARPVVTFNQSRFDKCAQWLEALKAQSAVALNRDNMKEELIGAAIGISLMTMVVNSGFWLYDMYKEGRSFSSLDVGSYAKSQVLVAAGFSAPRVLVACISKMWRERNQIRYDLAQKAYRDGDHVNIYWTEPYHHGDTRMVVTHSCPSKYAYNLFGKN